MDEIRVRCIPHCVTIITETWLNHNIPDAAIELAGCSIYRADRTKGNLLHSSTHRLKRQCWFYSAIR
ncbi:hypothetical protein NQZ68_035383 [Dissostichus eleginoides]|nr:hypothetical protein NQZ68_035383 [Dissostichus eleginoides]